ncbi:MAG TPA: hypothetical protein VJN93_14910 [Candidatus Acidoferrum sp.]|nr:hypothetical protein [Candidatus Acidoferrum sp.]
MNLATRIFSRAALILGGLLFFCGSCVFAQSADSSSVARPTASDGPTAALRDILSAACSQSQSEFERFLTVRNKASFQRMTPAARIAFMMRFVLLDEPGKPSVTENASGRPTVRCDTPVGAADIQIGGADTHDNVSFMPVRLHDATDNSSADAVQVNMGLVRENGEWKILSLGLVLLDLPSLEYEWDSAEADKNEQAAIQSLRVIANAVEAYRRKYLRLPDSISDLGPPLHGAASAQAAGLVDSDISSGMKNGYSFRYVIVGANTLGAPAKYELSATPIMYGRTGHRSFFRDAGGKIHGADHKGVIGSGDDPEIQ